MVTKINQDYENLYSNKVVRGWWLSQTEDNRRIMVRKYFDGCGGGNSERIDTLHGIMPEEMEEIHHKNSKIQEVQDSFNRNSVRAIISELFGGYSLKEKQNALIEFEVNY